MRGLAWWLAGGAALLLGCSEPDEQVVAATADGRFSLTLKTEKNWMHPGESLPIKVTIESLGGPLAQGLVDTLRLVANNGAVYPSRLAVDLAAAADSLWGAPRTSYVTWAYFTASVRPAEGTQGEVYASFLDALATLKIRIVPSPDSL